MNTEHLEKIDEDGGKYQNESDNKKKGSLWRIILLPILYLLIQIIVTVVFTLIFVDDFIQNSMVIGNKTLVLSLNISCIITFFTTLLIMKKYRPFKEYFKIKMISIKKVILIIISAFSFNLFISLILGLIDIEKYFPDYVNITKSLFMSENVFLVILAIGILAPIVEELIFRGSVYNLLRNFFGTKVSIVIQALVFGFIHLNMLQSSYAFILGLVLGVLYVRSESIKSVIIFHIAFNISAFAIDSLIPTFLTTDLLYLIAIIVSLVIAGVAFLFSIKKDDKVPVEN